MKRVLRGALLVLPIFCVASLHAQIAPGERLADVLIGHGITIRYDGPRCRKPGTLGSYNLKTRTVTLCAGNMAHAGQLFDTIRHEAIHVAQDCANRDTLFPSHETRRLAADSDLRAMALYPRHHFDSELEAHVLSRVTESLVIDLVNDYC
jgi:hypothetical protein